jgi:hypothetical protein
MGMMASSTGAATVARCSGIAKCMNTKMISHATTDATLAERWCGIACSR